MKIKKLHSPDNGKRNTILLSVVIATRNEEENLARCLHSVQAIADEIIIFDEHSTDKTREIAKSFGAKVFEVDHNDNFHITKQKAIDKATGEWILQLDADESVTPELFTEIEKVISATNEQILKRRALDRRLEDLFKRHQKAIEKRDGHLGKKTGEIVAFFVPRVNMFVGKPLIHGGVYPDGVIRLIKRGKARLPAKDIHEQMEIDGEVGWLYGNLEHYDSPTLRRYIWRMNRYTDLQAKDLADKKVSKNFRYFILYTIFKPLYAFISLYIRHKGMLDGIRGFLWSFFSALRFPLSYYKYWINTNKQI